MSRPLWIAAVLFWAALMVVLVVGGGQPIPGVAAAVGIVLLLGNGRALLRRRATPLTRAGSASAETMLAVALLTFAVVGALSPDGAAWTLVLIVSILAALVAVGVLLLRMGREGGTP